MPLALFICIIAMFFINHHKAPQYSIMSFEEYEPIEHDVPYLFKLIKPNQCLFYFGSNHSHNPENEQYSKLEQAWSKFLQLTKGQNCVVIIEGDLRPEHQTEIEAIIKDGETGFISFLAHQHNIVCISPEPDDTYLETQLRKSFSPDYIYYMRFTDIWHQFNELRKNDPTLDLVKYIHKFDDFLGRKNLDQFEKIHEQLFHTTFDVYNDNFLNKLIDSTKPTAITPVHRQNNILRDEYIVHEIHNLIKQGKNIFIVYGAAHAVMQEPAIIKIWN